MFIIPTKSLSQFVTVAGLDDQAGIKWAGMSSGYKAEVSFK